MRCGVFHAVWMFTVAVMAVSNAVVTCIPIREFDTMLDTLRATGYDLFSNAIVTSDLQFHLLSSSNQRSNAANDTNFFTFFAPTDASLFTLDITQTASSYTETLRFHIVPRRLSLADLRRLPDGSILPTLLPNRRLHLTRHRSSSSIAVAGVDVAVPGLFYGRHVAVHGLAGSLSLRSENPLSPASLPVPSPAGTLSFSPRFSPVSSPENLGPIPFNFGKRRGFHPPIESPAPENGVVDDDALEPQAGWTVVDSPAMTPVVWAPSISDSAISLPPEGYSDAAAPAGMEEGMVSSMESEVEGLRKCENHDHDHDVGIELEDYMHCYAT